MVLAVKSYLAVSAEKASLSRSAFAAPYFYLVPALSSAAFPLSSLLVVFQGGLCLGSVHANTFTYSYAGVAPVRARGLAFPRTWTGTKLQNRLPALRRLCRPELHFFFLWRIKKKAFFLLSVRSSICCFAPPLIPWLEGPMLWHLYAGHHRPFFLSHLITTVYKPVDLCVPPLLSYTGRSSFLCIFKGNTSLNSKSFLLRNISEQFFSADQLLLPSPGPSSGDRC